MRDFLTFNIYHLFFTFYHLLSSSIIYHLSFIYHLSSHYLFSIFYFLYTIY